MARSNKPQVTLDTIFFVSPEQKLLRFLMTEPTTAFTPRVLSSKLKGVRGLGGVDGITKILKSLQELGLVIFLNNNREICLQNDHPAIQLMKTFCAISDLEGLKQMIEPMSSKGVLFGSRASGKSRTDSNYNLLVVSETPEEIKKITSRHPLGKKLEPMVLTPDEFSSVENKNKDLSRQIDLGITLWGSSWVKALFFFLSIVFVIIGDQWSKLGIIGHFDYGESIIMIRDFFNITYVRNTGAAFGFLAAANPTFRVPFFLIVPIVAMVVLGFLYRDLPQSAKWRAMALGLVSGGAIGNLIDRVRLGYVVDFLDFHFRAVYYFPAFNVADSAICVGVTILLLSTLVKRDDAKDKGVKEKVAKEETNAPRTI